MKPELGSASELPQGEFSLIDSIRRKTGHSARTILGIGDDCALLRPTPGRDWLVTTDMLMDGRHFRLEHDSPEAVGYKALGVNLSDIAAMAGTALAAVVAVALPRSGAVEIAHGIHAGMSTLANRFSVDLVGGDTNAWDGPLVISITVLGEVSAQGAVRRSGGRAGDVILVTGPLGGSLSGRHLQPQPRLHEAQALQQAATLHAMIDISDGLAADLGHILEESGGLGAVLDADSIPIHTDALLESAEDGRTPLDHALNDGEDFELCVVVSPETADQLIRRPPPGVVLSSVGTITIKPGLWLRTRDGGLKPINDQGFDHLRR